MHWSPAQHASAAQDWPIWAHPSPPPESGVPPLPPSGVAPEPPSEVPGGGGSGEQVPAVAPGATTHVIPAQQSAVDVQEPAEGMHALEAQTSCPVESGTQGCPLQQSAAVAQVAPVWRQASVPPSERP